MLVRLKEKNNFHWIRTIVLAIIVAFIFRMFFFTSYIVEGESMFPTLEDGNLLIVNKIEYRIDEIDRFDVIVFHANETDDYVKRVIGLPGDEIAYRDDVLYINGEAYKEPYLQENKKELFSGQLTGSFTLEELTGFEKVPEGHLFVIGDNRRGSHDSRHFGFIPEEQVVGKVNLRYWPVEQWAVTF